MIVQDLQMQSKINSLFFVICSAVFVAVIGESITKIILCNGRE